MTNDEMINWAGFDLPSRTVGSADADFNAVKVHDTYTLLDKLIWIAQTQARQEVWKMISDVTKQNHDAEALSSYPGSGIRRKAING